MKTSDVRREPDNLDNHYKGMQITGQQKKDTS